jgi:hypothetical protein
MTANEIIETAMLFLGDTSAASRTKVAMLAKLRMLHRSLYKFVIRWNLDDVTDFERTTLSFTPDSDGKYALPSDFFQISAVHQANNSRPAAKAKWETVQNYNSGNLVGADEIFHRTDLAYCIHNKYIYICPASSGNMVLYYYPLLTDLELATEFPCNTHVDDIAIHYLHTFMLQNDRFADYDIRIDMANTERADRAAKAALLRLGYAPVAIGVPPTRRG